MIFDYSYIAWADNGAVVDGDKDSTGSTNENPACSPTLTGKISISFGIMYHIMRIMCFAYTL